MPSAMREDTCPRCDSIVRTRKQPPEYLNWFCADCNLTFPPRSLGAADKLLATFMTDDMMRGMTGQRGGPSPLSEASELLARQYATPTLLRLCFAKLAHIEGLSLEAPVA